MNRPIKFLRHFFFDEECTKYSHSSEWGPNIFNVAFTSPSSNNFAYHYIDAQFTGLFDKKGNEIYEGDILREPAKSDWDKINFQAYEVFFHDNDCCDRHIGFQMNRMHFYGSVGGGTEWFTFRPKHVSKMELMGNIYKNPELVKK